MEKLPDKRIIEYADSFSVALAEALSSVTGDEFTLSGKVEIIDRLDLDSGSIAFIPFAGPIAGDYFICTKQTQWQEIIDELVDDGDIPKEIFSEILKEILNSAVGSAITEVQQDYDNLTIMPPRCVHGEMICPSSQHAKFTLSGNDSEIEITGICAVDSMRQQIENALQEIEEKKNEAQLFASKLEDEVKKGVFNLKQAKSKMRNILDSVEEIILTVDRKLVVTEDCSKSSRKIFGDDFIGKNITDVIAPCLYTDSKTDFQIKKRKTIDFLQQIFSTPDPVSFVKNTDSTISSTTILTNKEEKTFNISYSPIMTDNKIEKVVIVLKEILSENDF